MQFQRGFRSERQPNPKPPRRTVRFSERVCCKTLDKTQEMHENR